MGLLRFDLSSSLLGGARADINDAELKMVYQRTGPQTGSFDIYGVLPETAGENDWAENAISFNGAPGLTFDGDTSTRGINSAATVLLGSVAFTNQTKPTSAAEVANDSGVITFGDNEDNTALINFLKQSDTDDLVTFIITVTTEGNTQFRLASKELTSLESGAPVGSAGDFASRLVVAIPEPASLGLLAAGGLALLGRRRRGV
jgi:hypothetical protein